MKIGSSTVMMLTRFLVLILQISTSANAFSFSSSFLGSARRSFQDSVRTQSQEPVDRTTGVPCSSFSTPLARRACDLVMRKQKASDKRTRRRQRGILDPEPNENSGSAMGKPTTFTTSPMQERGAWDTKKVRSASALPPRQFDARSQQQQQQQQQAPWSSSRKAGVGRGRSRKRTAVYQRLSSYHDTFLRLLTLEYEAEENEVIDRIEASLDDPLALESGGHALLDMYPTRRGNLYTDEVYRLTKARDATVTYNRTSKRSSPSSSSLKGRDGSGALPPNQKFSKNDVILLTRQPRGSGDFFDPSALPTRETADRVEARVLNMGPTYIDIVINAGAFEAGFGQPAPNDLSGRGDGSLRVRVDRFFSKVPYQRMVSALAQTTHLSPNQAPASGPTSTTSKRPQPPVQEDAVALDQVLRDMIVSTFRDSAETNDDVDENSRRTTDELARLVAKPPMPTSTKLGSQVVRYMQSQPALFPPLNGPQLAAVYAALTRRCTLIQGPPGTGKTTVASAIAFGFVHQCRNLSENTKVLACAFSNVGADNLAETLMKRGLKIVRIGKPSAVSESLWNTTIDAAIDRDPDAQKALEKAAAATALLSKQKRAARASSSSSRQKTNFNQDRINRQAATAAVKASIQACNVVATKAFRDADVIVATSTGAADPRLLAACGLVTNIEDDDESEGPSSYSRRSSAPDGFAPLSLPFVLIDEACQSVEPASLIPIVSSNSCRAVVMLGDPCQLPPTVRHAHEHGDDTSSSLSVSLMERLAAVLPAPNVQTPPDGTEQDMEYLDSLAIKRARSLLLSWDRKNRKLSYRKKYAGSILLSIQYRMHPSIAALPSAIFYDGLLATPGFLAASRKSLPAVQAILPISGAAQSFGVRLVDIGGRSNEQQGSPNGSRGQTAGLQQTSYWNQAEAGAVMHVIRAILTENKTSEKTIGVVSPYSGQVQLIQSLLNNDDTQDIKNSTMAGIEVKSVDGYQGRERDVIIFSAVRSNREGSIGFLRDWRRLNVALTRARSDLIVVGDFQTLIQNDKHWASLWTWGCSVNCVVPGIDEILAPIPHKHKRNP